MASPTAAPKHPLSPFLEDIRQQLEKVNADVSELVVGLSDDQFSWRPAPERWSVGECIEHLRLSGANYLEPIDNAIAEARARGLAQKGAVRPGILGGMFARSMEPPYRMKARTFGTLVPGAGLARERVLADFLVAQQRLIERLHAAAGVSLDKVRVQSPFAKWLRLRLGAVLCFLAAHERRHVWQAEQVMAHPEFPKA